MLELSLPPLLDHVVLPGIANVVLRVVVQGIPLPATVIVIVVTEVIVVQMSITRVLVSQMHSST